MANTPNFNWVLPTVGGTAYQWGNYLNTIFGQQDSLIRILANTAIANTAPSYIQAGTQWINNTSSPWAYSIYDGTDWVLVGNIDPVAHEFIPVFETPSILPPVITKFTTTGSYTPNSALSYAIVELVGAGSGGGGGTTGQPSAPGAGGGAGGYGRATISAATMGSSPISVIIGTPGTGGTASANGSNATATSFGSFLIETPSQGGVYFPNVGGPYSFLGGANGTVSGSDTNWTGNGATAPLVTTYSTGSSWSSGAGANSFYGAGGAGVIATTGGGNGNPGTFPGGGGSGALGSNTISYTGGNGAGGYVIVYEYLNGVS